MVIAAAGLLGLLLGSFATVLAARVPDGRDIVVERSHCTSCGSMVRWYDNVPVISWLVLRGRCRDCSARISVTYPLMELAVAGLCALSAWRWGLTLEAAMLVILAPVSAALVVIDVQRRRLPHALVLPSLAVVGAVAVAHGIMGGGTQWWVPLAGAGAIGGFYGLLWLVYPRGLGFGDVTTGALIGGAAGVLGWAQVAVAAISGPLLGGVLVLVLAMGGRARRGTAIPYGPALIAGGWLGFLAGDIITEAYLRALGVS